MDRHNPHARLFSSNKTLPQPKKREKNGRRWNDKWFGLTLSSPVIKKKLLKYYLEMVILSCNKIC